MSSTQFVEMYHPLIPATATSPVEVAVQSVDDHAARGWLLVDPNVAPPAPATPYYTRAELLSQIQGGAAPIGTALRAAFGLGATATDTAVAAFVGTEGTTTRAELDKLTASLADRGAFAPAATYARGDVVQHNGSRYSAKRPGAAGTATKVRTNAVPNPRMQNNRAGWSAGTNTTVTADAPNSRVLLTTSAAIVAGNTLYLLSTDIPAQAGEVWSAAVRVSVPADGVAVALRAMLGFFPVASTNFYGPTIVIQPGTSAVLSIANATCPVGKTGVRLQIQAGTGIAVASGAKVYVDQPIVEKAVAPGNYFDGTGVATADTSYAWAGTADSSPSTATTVSTVNTLGTPGSAGSGWGLLVPAPKPTRTALGAAYSPTITDATRRIAWLTDDRITLLTSNAAAFAFSRDDAATWTTARTFTNPVISARSLPSGEVLVATRADVTTPAPFELWLSTGWQTDPTTATWTKVLTGTTAMASPANWSWSVYGNLVLVAEYGPKEGSAYNGQTVAPGGNARYVYRSLDGGRSFTTIFDLNAWLTARGGQSTTGCHLHGVHFDPYWDRIWLSHGDDRNGILYSDDLGATWQQAQDGSGSGGRYQSVGIISLPQCVLFAADGTPNGIARISRSQGKHAGLYEMEDAYAINNQATLTHLCQSIYKAPRPGDDAPVVFGFAPDSVAGKSLIVTTVDGYTFNGAWTDNGADATSGLDGAYGPTVRGNLVVHNGTTNKFLVGPMPGY